MDAELVNFSLDDSSVRVMGIGAWATAVNSAWPPATDWRDARVTIKIPEGSVVFDEAKVQGPISEGDGTHAYCGFRIKLGSVSPGAAVGSLKGRWDLWDKR
jgi:hypothetical protein